MTTAFTPGADFSAIDTTTHVFIGDVLHKAFVSVDESGTEAAAATAVIGVGTAAPLQPTAIRADRPFFFAIRDVPTGAIIFAGRVADPSAN
jgi:serpin B